ncbi:hypothetical protein Q3G72_019709 [Acer saccharum]|nr:hypothetical protein Q3G72_019709 [Acer saccharum]
MDEQLFDALCDRLKPVLYTEESYIVREGDPVDEMLFIMRGKLLTVTTNSGFFNSESVFCPVLQRSGNHQQHANSSANELRQDSFVSGNISITKKKRRQNL